jgi:hypothetical protein
MNPYQRTSCYIVAHQDDWQLFMNPEVSADLGDKECRTIIIHTTAGDAGDGRHYWEAREKAAIDSVIFRLSSDSLIERNEGVWINGDKRISFTEINNCILYFLRLPDGAYDGSGFGQYGNQSLEKFRRSGQEAIISVDQQNKYGTWNELTHTLDHIIGHELGSHIGGNGGALVCLNFPEPDPLLNPDDHNDHFNTALLLQGTAAYEKYRKRAFVHYHIRDYDNFLSGPELFWKTGMFSVYHQSLLTAHGHSTLSEDPSFIPWCLLGSVYREI